MVHLWAVQKTGIITVQKSLNLHRKFRTMGRQTSIIGAVAQPKNQFPDGMFCSELISGRIFFVCSEMVTGCKLTFKTERKTNSFFYSYS